MEIVRIRVCPNGPLEVTGKCDIVDPKGVTLPAETEEPIYLCRCGQSGNKPFCDGTHKKVGFRG